MTTPNRELRLDELLQDPIVHLVMARDRISPDHVRAVIADVNARRAANRDQPRCRAA